MMGYFENFRFVSLSGCQSHRCKKDAENIEESSIKSNISLSLKQQPRGKVSAWNSPLQHLAVKTEDTGHGEECHGDGYGSSDEVL